ncbi:MAG: prepilin-type N-terminal cleavage/methylation domain-containing protein [Pseudomonadota bacterium]|nr:prepilin-type N-terminal cleavage/methylation domain-containing protein [Pseudomonadota bacterium]
MSASPSSGGRRQRGYTLIEVIVAFALLALALTLLLGTLSGAVRQVRWSGDAGRAALHAQSLMDTVGVGQNLLPGRRDGQFDAGRYRWELTIEPWDEPLPPNAPVVPRAPGFHRLYEIALSVEWGDAGPRERLELRTLRLAPVEPGVVLP